MEEGCLSPFESPYVVLGVNPYPINGVYNNKDGFLVKLCYTCEILIDFKYRYVFKKDNIKIEAMKHEIPEESKTNSTESETSSAS